MGALRQGGGCERRLAGAIQRDIRLQRLLRPQRNSPRRTSPGCPRRSLLAMIVTLFPTRLGFTVLVSDVTGRSVRYVRRQNQAPACQRSRDRFPLGRSNCRAQYRVSIRRWRSPTLRNREVKVAVPPRPANRCRVRRGIRRRHRHPGIGESRQRQCHRYSPACRWCCPPARAHLPSPPDSSPATEWPR
jgi:hypothetical protein